MPLILTMLRVPTGVALQQHEVVRKSVSLGRGRECDWVLPDVERILSKIHCLLSNQDGRWFVTDMSSNGTRLDGDLLDPGVPRRVHHGERLGLGDYEIQIGIHDTADPGEEPEAYDRTTYLTPRAESEPPTFPVQATTVRHHAGEAAGLATVSEKALAAAVALIAEGAGITGTLASPASEVLHDLGRALHAFVTELRNGDVVPAAMKARADRTPGHTESPRPLGQAPNTEAALAALLGVGRPGGKPVIRALVEPLRDLQRHSLAVTRANRRAVEEMLAHLAPDRILQELTPSPIDALPGHRRHRAFKAYKVLHARILSNLESGSDTMFDRALGRAYEAALAELSADNQNS